MEIQGPKQQRGAAGGPEKTLAAHAASSAVWMASQTVVSRVVGLGSQWALTWLLVPEHFGQIALVNTITMFAQHLTAPGTDDVLIQKRQHLRRWISSAFWLTIACGIAGALLMVLAGLIVVTIAGHVGNEAYGSPDVLKMIAIFALGAPLNAASTVMSVSLRAELRFGKVAAVGLFEIVAQQLLCVAFALAGFKAYSLVIPMPIVAAARLALLWYLVQPRLHARLGMHRWPRLVLSTGWVLGQRILATGVHHGDQILLGAILADKVVNGYYYFAVVLTQQVVRLLCENLIAVLVPVLSSFSRDRQRLEGATARACHALGATIIPLCTLQILLAGPVIRLLFAEKWEPAIPLVQWLSAAPLLFATAYPMSAMITASGRFRAAFMLAAVNLITFFAIVTPMTYARHAQGAAIGVTISYWLAAHFFAFTAFGSVRGITVLYRSVARTLLSAAIAAAPGFALLRLFPGSSHWHDAIVMAVTTPLVLGIYWWMLGVFDPSAAVMLRHRLGGAFGAIIRRLSARRRQRAAA